MPNRNSLNKSIYYSVQLGISPIPRLGMDEEKTLISPRMVMDRKHWLLARILAFAGTLLSSIIADLDPFIGNKTLIVTHLGITAPNYA